MIPYVAMLALLAAALPAAFAEMDLEVSVLGDSILVKFTNISDEVAEDLVVWTESENILSHSTEPMWTGRVDGTSMRIVEDIGPGQTLRLGLEMASIDAGLAWQASFGDSVIRGWVVEPAPVDEVPDDDGDDEPVAEPVVYGVLDGSSFSVIPAKPTAGSPVRLVGNGFGAMQELSLEIGSRTLFPVSTDDMGNFVVTRTVPYGLDDRVDFVLADSEGREIVVSIRLGDGAPALESVVRLSIDDIDRSYTRGSMMHVSGTAAPLSTISLSTFDSDGLPITMIPVMVGHDGAWSIEVLVPPYVSLGEHAISVYDGSETVEGVWEVVTSRTILIAPTHDRFGLGTPLRFSGTAEPGVDMEIVLLNPHGNELAYSILEVDSTGEVYWEYPTDASFQSGTYTLVVTQAGTSEFVYAGLDANPIIPVAALFDKPNYDMVDMPNVMVLGPPNEEVRLLVITPTDNVILEDVIALEPNGQAHYQMSLSNFGKGVYTAILQKGTAQSEYQFGVGLSSTTSGLSIQTRNTHAPGDLVLVLGQTDPNTVMTMSLLTPSGNEVQHMVVFSDRSGMISESRMRVPLDAEDGVWSVKVVSGSTVVTSDIVVGSGSGDSLAVSVEDSDIGIVILVSGASNNYVTITITDGQNQVGSPIRSYTTNDGTGQLPWHIDVPGIYTITVEDGDNTAQTTYRYDSR